jgi:hypothetical protein
LVVSEIVPDLSLALIRGKQMGAYNDETSKDGCRGGLVYVVDTFGQLLDQFISRYTKPRKTHSKEDIRNVHRDENSITDISQIERIRPSNQPEGNDMLSISSAPYQGYQKDVHGQQAL